MRKLGAMKQRLRERAQMIFGMAVQTGGGDDNEDEDANEDAEKQGREKGRPSNETAVGTAPPTPTNQRKPSRSLSWLPRIFVRGATVDDSETPAMTPHAEMEEV